MKNVITFLAILLMVVVVWAFNLWQADRIIKKSVDERGLISIQFKCGSDTLALDYLTPAEYQQFLRTGDPFNK